jgi:hypothetical protein
MTDESAPKEESFRDELGVEDLSNPVSGSRGRLFSTAGRESPIAELTEEYVILHPPQKPYNEEDFDENISERISPRGVLLSAIGIEIKIPGAKFRGHPLYCLSIKDDQTGKRLAAYFDESGTPRLLFFEGKVVTHFQAVMLRNKTHNGDLSNTAGLVSSADTQS